MKIAPGSTMREFIAIVIAIVLTGCCTKPKSVTTESRADQGHASAAAIPEVSFPKTTDFDFDFDDDAEVRAAYMAAFKDGYQFALQGGHGVICTFGHDGRRGIAREIGYMRGQTAAQKFLMDRDLERALEQARRIKEPPE